ncbi:hypothetical protein PHYBOEH_010988 [Phytophthora boehmeriae]|uniref:Cysteine-rich protein n=1 Tax=Phytophthora boehmeriae TaxID=109152 RepID=A0A8T1VMC8_9STRA|nr:hypothetical protein PHYBOEH_010988 [Phytophthora boehmeriae]
MLKSFLLAMILTTAVTTPARGGKPRPSDSPESAGVQCAEGENQMSVEGVEGIFCVSGDVCLATFSTGNCPPPQEGLPYGSYCGIVASGVYGCKTRIDPATPSEVPTVTPAPVDTSEPDTTEPPTDAPDTPEPPSAAPITPAPSSACSDGNLRVSVQGLQNAYCVVEPVCVSDVSDGNCPGPQPGLPYGSFCSLLETNVYGCKPFVAANQPSTASYEAPRDCSTTPGDSPVSIVGSDEVFCAPYPVCSGANFGNCPEIQDGLTQASDCMIIDTGVYGCVFMAST